MHRIEVGMMTPEIGQKLARLGVPEKCRRIVIDIKAMDVAVVYYETYTDAETLDVLIDAALQIKGTLDVS